MSSFLEIQHQEFKEDDAEDEDFALADFALKHVMGDVAKTDNINVALGTRSRVQIPDSRTAEKRKALKQQVSDAEFSAFLMKMWQPMSPEMYEWDKDPEFNVADNAEHEREGDEHKARVSRREVMDLNANRLTSAEATTMTNIKIPIREHQRKAIRTQLKQLFQMLVLIRHLSLDTSRHVSHEQRAHTLSTQLLHRYDQSRRSCVLSIRTKLAKRFRLLADYNTSEMSPPQINALVMATTEQCYISSAMDIVGCNQYMLSNREQQQPQQSQPQQDGYEQQQQQPQQGSQM